MENLGTHELRTMVTEAADEAVNIGYRVAALSPKAKNPLLSRQRGTGG